MSTTARPIGFRHELLLHRSTAELLESVVPFVRDGAAAEESTLLLVRPATARAVLDRVDPSPHLTVQPALAKPGRPAAHAHAAGPLLSGYARVLHEEPVIPRAQWSEWRRLEAALNVILRRHDTWAVCAYDRHMLSEDMVDDLNAAHPLLAQDGSHRPNDRYREPRAFLDARPDTPIDPAGRGTPAVELVEPSPAAVRAAVRGLVTRLPGDELENLVLATHEAVANAISHGRPPVVVRAWVAPERVTVTVTDAGPGPGDPLAGFLPPRPGADRGLGLWISHHLVGLTHHRHPGGHTVRLAAGDLIGD